MKSSGAYLVLAALLAGLIGFRYFVMSQNPAAPTTAQTPRPTAPEDELVEAMPQVKPPDPSDEQAMPPLPTAPQPLASPAHAVRTPEGALSYGSSVGAQLPEKPPGSKPDPLQSKKAEKDPAWGDSNAGPDTAQASRVIPRGGTLVAKAAGGGPDRRKQELELSRVKKRVEQITAPVERLLAEAATSACGRVDFYEIPERVERSRVATQPRDGILRDWWSTATLDMLCRGDIGPCAERMKNADDSDSFSWACPRVGLYAHMKTLLRGGDNTACVMALSSGKDGAKGVQALAPAARGRACGLLTAAFKQGDMAICQQFPELITGEGDLAKSCRSELAFARGVPACSEFNGDDPEDELDKQTCLSQATALAAIKADDAGRCGGNRICKAMFGDNEVCGRVPSARMRDQVGKHYCKWAEAEFEYRSSSKVLAASRTAETKLQEYMRTLKEFSVGVGDKPANSAHLVHVRTAIERMQRIAKEQHAASIKHFAQ